MIIYFKPLAVFLLIGINDIYAMNLPEGEQTENYISDNNDAWVFNIFSIYLKSFFS